MNVLITTLGKTSSASGQYHVVRYKFGEETSSPTPFFGAALREHLEKNGTHINQIVILGTSGSMWDAWLAREEAFLREQADLAERLQTAQMSDRVGEALLQELSMTLEKKMNVKINCRLIPYGQTEEEQLKILQIISTCANDGDQVYMDVTHGLRHLPMLEMQSAFLMQSRFETAGIYYGALDRQSDGVAPVVTMTGAMRINAWSQAIAILQATGNVAPLARLPGMETFRETLLNYQFYVQISNLRLARNCASEILRSLDKLPPEGCLFESELRLAFGWSEGLTDASRQFEQSQMAFDIGDYTRSVILLKESLVSAYILKTNPSQDLFNQTIRCEKEDELRVKYWENKCKRFHDLLDLRNSFAHNKDNLSTITEGDFRERMRGLFEWVKKEINDD